MKKKLIKGKYFIIIDILCCFSFILLSNGYSINRIVADCKKVNAPNIQESNIKTFDLTDLVTGEDAQHEHIYEQKYDENMHWEECWICKDKKNVSNHKLAISGIEGCAVSYGTQAEYCTDGCGYSKTLPKKAHTIGEWYPASDRAQHMTSCTVCKLATGAENCTNSEGQVLGCSSGIDGTCVKCGQQIDSRKHAYLSNGKCVRCGKQFFTYSLIKKEPVGISGTRYEVELTQIDKDVELDFSRFSVQNHDGLSFTPSDVHYEKIGENKYKLYGTITFNQETVAPMVDSGIMGFTYKYNNFVNNSFIYITTNTKNNVPSRKDIVSEGNGTVDNYSRKATVTATYIDEYDNDNNVLYMRLLDKDKQTVIADWAAALKDGNIYTRVFDIVAEIRDVSNIYVQVKDKCNNITEIDAGNVQVQYIDALAPRLIEGKTSTEEWSQKKQITYKTTDLGVGEVQIGFNNQTDFALAEKDGDIYTRTYNFVGDVYGNVTAALYIKDKLGNIRTEKVTISNLDNTAPTITNATINNSTITIEANDINKKLGEGSGIVNYRYIASNEKIENINMTQENSKLVEAKGNFKVENVKDLKYIYVMAIDRAGNESNIVEIEVPQLSLISRVNLQLAEGKGGVELDWPNYDKTNKMFKIYKKTEGSDEWQIVKNSNPIEGNLTDLFETTSYIDEMAQDMNAPEIPNIEIGNINVETNKIPVAFSSNDKGNKYLFYVSAVDKMDKNEILSVSNQREETVITGMKGYYYVIDENEINDFNVNEDTVNYVEQSNIELDLENNGKYIHVKAVDVAGNVGNEQTARIYITSKLTIDPNTGIYEGKKEPTEIEELVGKTIKLSTPTKEGNTFLEWITSKGIIIKDSEYTFGIESEVIVANWEKNEYNYTIYYKDRETGKEIYSPMQDIKKYGDVVEAKEYIKDIEGYKYEGCDKDSISIETDKTKNVITLYYERKIAKVIVKYQDENGNMLAEDIIIDGKVFDEYQAKEEEIEGYEVAVRPVNETGKMTEQPIEVVYIYQKKKYDYKIYYKDRETGKEIYSMYENIESYKNTIEAKEYIKDIEGYKYEGCDKASISIETDNTKNVITLYYERKIAKVIVKYQDENGNMLAEDIIIDGKVFDEYQAKEEEIEGYEVAVRPVNETGKMTEQPIEVVYIYQKKKYDYKIYYKDRETGKEIYSMYENSESYKNTIEAKKYIKNIKGYKYEGCDKDSISVETDKEKNVITLYYVKIDAKVVVKYQDEDGNMLAEDILIDGKVFDEYQAKEEEIEGYEIAVRPVNETGKITEQPIEVVYIYQKKKYDYKIYYKDKETEKEIYSMYENSESYKNTIEAKEYIKDIEGYKYEGCDKASISIETDKTKNVITLYYVKIDAKVIVKYQDENGNMLAEDTTIKGKIFDEYETKAKKIEGFEVEKVLGNAKGNMETSDTIITYIYKEKGLPEILPNTGNRDVYLIIVGIVMAVFIILNYIKYKKLKY